MKNRLSAKNKPPQKISTPIKTSLPLEPTWAMLPYLLVIAFVLRAIIAFSGDFVIHPDEIMQYLEPAHNAVFGAGIAYWEYFYGARSWLVPGLVAGVLWLFKSIGLDNPLYYIAAVKLLFCFISLLVPWGMYVFSRSHWGEKTARIALLFGVFWYELIGFAHKPMTEFVATSIFMALLAIYVLPIKKPEYHPRRMLIIGMLGALLIAVRFQYIPVAGAFLLFIFWLANTREKVALVGGFAIIIAAVGVLDTLTWGAPFHSYYVNIGMNIIVGAERSGESSILVMPIWLIIASAGILFLTAMAGVVADFRRRRWIFALILLILIPHMLQNHREYRFIFACIPLWLMLLADYAAVLITQRRRQFRPLLFGLSATFSIISLLGIFNKLPFQSAVYTGYSLETGRINFITNQDPIFKIYRYLSNSEYLQGVIDAGRPYFNTPGYYYLHQSVPLYDTHTLRDFILNGGGDAISKHASHVIAYNSFSHDNPINSIAHPDTGQLITTLQSDRGVHTLPVIAWDTNTRQLIFWDKNGNKEILANYQLVMQIDDITLWENQSSAAVQKWKNYNIMVGISPFQDIMRKLLGKNTPELPKTEYNIEFTRDNQESTGGDNNDSPQ